MMFRAVKAEPSEQPYEEKVVLICEGPLGDMTHEVVLDVHAWAAMGAPEVVDVYVYAPDRMSSVLGGSLLNP